jgi:hypothetical protein
MTISQSPLTPAITQIGQFVLLARGQPTGRHGLLEKRHEAPHRLRIEMVEPARQAAECGIGAAALRHQPLADRHQLLRLGLRNVQMRLQGAQQPVHVFARPGSRPSR